MGRRMIGLVALTIPLWMSFPSAPAAAGSLAVWTAAPAEGARLSGVVTWRIGYSMLPRSVRFRVDGSTVASDTAAPFRFRLDTAAYPPGRHTLTAVARRGTQRVRTAVTVRFLDSRPPSSPDGLVVRATDSSLILGWLPSTDNVGVAAYRLLDGAGAGSTTAPRRCPRFRFGAARRITSGLTHILAIPASPATTPGSTPSSVLRTARESTTGALCKPSATPEAGVGPRRTNSLTCSDSGAPPGNPG